jgi:mannose-1-phosphate guanylyltransferase
MAVLTADHFITATAGFRQALAAAGSLAGEGRLVTLGIKPSAPATGYGYIQRGALLSEAGGFSVYGVERFVEKPALPAAVQMVASGEFSWNSGMFVWQVSGILAEFYEQLENLSNVLGSASFPEALARTWPQVKKQSIDYGVMEGAHNVVVLPVDIGWSDIGSWASLYALLPADEDGNVWTGPHQGIDTHNTLAFGSRRQRPRAGSKRDRPAAGGRKAIRLAVSSAREADLRV